MGYLETPQYAMTFSSATYDNANFSLPVDKLLSFFNCADFPLDDQKNLMAAACESFFPAMKL